MVDLEHDDDLIDRFVCWLARVFGGVADVVRLPVVLDEDTVETAAAMDVMLHVQVRLRIGPRHQRGPIEVQ
jgi:hypothetical protein